MPDSLKVEVEVDLTNLPRYRRVGEDDYEPEPMTLSQAIVERAAILLVEQLGKDEQLRKITDAVTRETIRQHVISRLEKLLTEPITISHGRYGDSTTTTTVTEVIDQEIKEQLTVSRNGSGYGGVPSVLNQVINANVNARLTADLNEAFLTARKAMIEAATEAGKKALAAAVGKALG